MSEFKTCCGGNCTLCVKGCSRTTDKLNTYDWLADLPDNNAACNIVEVQFKPPRKSYYINSNNLDLKKGDIVAVEANPGHDIGTVTMTGRLVPLQIKKANLKSDFEFKRIYRLARNVDMDKFHEAKAHEHETMIESRQIAKNLGLKMKIGDVEYQGDGNKAIFYYIADERVDFRQLIRVLAERFHVRIEMKQIGARQEAGRIGGIGPCGRELCCATWMTHFVSVSTSAARFQDISLNPQKLAGQCAKLKCCLNYEVDQYVESLKRLPSKEISLQTQDNEYFFFKADILAHRITYSTDKHILANETTISAKRAFEIINMNKAGQKPESLIEEGQIEPETSKDLLDQENINRFDRNKNKRKKKNNGKNNNANAQANANRQQERTANSANKEAGNKNNNGNKKQKENNSSEKNSSRNNRPNRGNRPTQGDSRERPQKQSKGQNANNGNTQSPTTNKTNAQKKTVNNEQNKPKKEDNKRQENNHE